MTERIGLWLNGARGSVATTAVSGLLALRAGLVPPVGCVTELLDASLAPWDAFVVGGHDIVTTPLTKRVESLVRDGVLPHDVAACIASGLEAADAEIRPGHDPAAFSGSQAEAARRLAADIADFRSRHGLARVVVVNVASPGFPPPSVRSSSTA